MSDLAKNNDEVKKPMSAEFGFYYQAIVVKWLLLATAVVVGVLGVIVLLIVFVAKRRERQR